MNADSDARARGAHLGRAELDQLRSQLAEQRAVLMERLGEPLGHAARAQADDSASEIAVAYAAESLAEIEAAQRRLDADTYGWCEACQGAIPIERLEVVPAAARCVRCQTRNALVVR